ncbi:MAG TPA: TSUP family transporter [Kofleriaceae bacterium]|nr:TSUP family transporter [Kofleriaceae bacterium]
MDPIDPIVVAMLAVASFLAGTVDAIAGGGGLITLPSLLAAGLPPHLAFGTNKGQSVWGSGAALATFWRAGRVDRRQGALAFPLGLLGAAVGARLVLLIESQALRPIAIAMLIGAAALLVVRKPARAEDEAGVDDARARRYLARAAVIALVIGAYDGFFGPGTGTFLIVGFVAFCGKGLPRATADAKVVNFASNIAALAAFAYAGAVAWSVALPMAAGQLAGGFVGARLALRGGARLIRLAVLAVSGALVAKLVHDLI